MLDSAAVSAQPSTWRQHDREAGRLGFHTGHANRLRVSRQRHRPVSCYRSDASSINALHSEP